MLWERSNWNAIPKFAISLLLQAAHPFTVAFLLWQYDYAIGSGGSLRYTSTRKVKYSSAVTKSLLEAMKQQKLIAGKCFQHVEHHPATSFVVRLWVVFAEIQCPTKSISHQGKCHSPGNRDNTSCSAATFPCTAGNHQPPGTQRSAEQTAVLLGNTK